MRHKIAAFESANRSLDYKLHRSILAESDIIILPALQNRDILFLATRNYLHLLFYFLN